MKVCIVADVLGEENNGTTKACMNLVRYLKSKGDTVNIICCDQDKKGVEGYFVVPCLNLGPINAVLRRNNVSLSWPKKKVIAEAIEGCEIVHIMMAFALGNAAKKYCLKNNIPFTIGFHAQAENITSHFGVMNSNLANYIAYHWYNRVFKHATAIHYPTEFIKDLFQKTTKNNVKSYVISNGVNSIFKKKEVNRPEELKDKIVILSTGRYCKEKNQKILIKSIQYSKYADKIVLYLAGQGPDKDKLKRLAKKYLKNKPIMKFLHKEELVDVINYSDLYVHPSIIEIEALGCLEAISCGVVPVIANSNRSATRFFALDERNLFKNNDKLDLAKKIDYWLDNVEERNKCSEIYLNRATNYDQDSCMEEMRKMLLENKRTLNNEK